METLWENSLCEPKYRSTWSTFCFESSWGWGSRGKGLQPQVSTGNNLTSRWKRNGYFLLSLPTLPQSVWPTKWAMQPASLQDISYIRKKMTWACSAQHGVSFKKTKIISFQVFSQEVQKLQFPVCQMWYKFYSSMKAKTLIGLLRKTGVTVPLLQQGVTVSSQQLRGLTGRLSHLGDSVVVYEAPTSLRSHKTQLEGTRYCILHGKPRADTPTLSRAATKPASLLNADMTRALYFLWTSSTVCTYILGSLCRETNKRWSLRIQLIYFFNVNELDQEIVLVPLSKHIGHFLYGYSKIYSPHLKLNTNFKLVWKTVIFKIIWKVKGIRENIIKGMALLATFCC